MRRNKFKKVSKMQGIRKTKLISYSFLGVPLLREFISIIEAGYSGCRMIPVKGSGKKAEWEGICLQVAEI